MPCYDPQAHEDCRQCRKEVNRLTDLLCQAGRAFVNAGAVPPPEVLDWWDQHRKWDEERSEPW